MRYALVQDQTGSRILVHARTDSADSRAISILNPNALVGERIQSSKPLTEEHLIQGALSTVPLTSLRWSAITPGSRIVYAGIDDRQPIAIEEILAMEPSQRGSHARIVTCLRTPLDGSPAKLLQEERIESSLIIPPTDLPAACSVFVYRNNIAESGPFSEVLQRERPESLRTEQLSSALRDLLQRYSLDRQDRADSKQLHSMAQETRAKRFFSPDAYVTYLTEAAAVNTDYQEMQRTLEKWYRDLDSLSSPPVTSFLHVATLAIRRTLYSDSSEKMRIEHILASTVQIIKTAPQVVQDLQSTQEVLRLFERTSLEFSRLSELPETIQTFSFAEVTPDILARCAQIAQSRVVASRELPTASTSADSFSKGGFLYSEYTPDYLSDALRRGALLTVMHNHRIDPATPVAFTLLHDSKSLPAHLKALLPGNREDGHSYFEVIASDKDLSNPLLNSQLFKSTLARSVLSGSIGIKAITHVENRTIQNMLVKAGFEVAPSSRVSLANPLSATDGKYMVWTKRFSEQRRAVAASAPITRAITHEGYLTSRPDEFKQMSSLAASLGEKPITWFSFGVDSLTGEKLDAVKRCIAISGLSELEGVATYIPTKTVVRLPHSETEPDQHSPQWRIEEENGAGLIESLVHGRTVHQTTVGLALLDPNDPMANTGARTLMPDGTEADLLMMRGNSQKRTAYNYQACNHALRFRVSFPEVADKKSIWDLGNHRAIEFLSLFDNRMCVFAGGGTTILRGITLAIESALEQRKGKTTIVLLKGAGGMTDHAAEHLEQLFPQISTGDAFEFLEVKVVNIESSPEELRAVLERSGRLPSSSDEPR
jgi:hypothetical protein